MKKTDLFQELTVRDLVTIKGGTQGNSATTKISNITDLDDDDDEEDTSFGSVTTTTVKTKI